MKADIQQMAFVHATLRSLVTWLEHELGVEFIATSLYRMHNEDSVHGQLPLRGIDLRCRDPELGHFLEQYVNDDWIYDPSRPELKCAIYHDSGHGPHLHLQVHDYTVLAE